MAVVNAKVIENAIEFPGSGLADLMLDFEWLVPMVDGRVCGPYGAAPFTTDFLFTSPERFEPLKAENQRGKEFEANP